MKNSSDSAFILMCLSYLLAGQSESASAVVAFTIGGCLWLVVAVFRAFHQGGGE